MSEVVEQTLTAYLGVQFQEKLMWQLLVEPDFAEKALPELAVEYFDDLNLKRLFIIIMEYYNEFGKVPNLQNFSIHQAINKFKRANNIIEEESLFEIIKRIELWNEMIINKKKVYDGDEVQKDANAFIKQQEFRKIGEYIVEKTKTGEMKSKYTISYIEERFQKAQHIGEADDDSEELIDHPERALRLEFRQTIATGIEVIDGLTGGGLGKGEVGIILSPTGVGKSTSLTKIANTAYEDCKNVAQIIFEDTKDQIKRKHYTIWSGIALSKLDDNLELALERVNKKIDEVRGKGRLVIKKFSDDNTTIQDIRNWMISYEKKYGFKFDILVLDYLDCLESHKKAQDRNESELVIIKGFLKLASDFDIPCWSALQSNRCIEVNSIVTLKSNGDCKIGSVNIGDEILTNNGYRKITEVFPITKQRTYKIKLKSGKEIICSAKHEFPTTENKLKSINSGLCVENNLYSKNSQNDLIEDEIMSIEYYGEEDTIDITVEDEHMFFANGIYTHNSGIDSEFVEAHQLGGNIKRLQKSHFFMSVAKTPDQKQAQLANIRILKARFATDGQTFTDCIFNNDTMEIRIEDDRYKSAKLSKGQKHHDEKDIEKLESSLNKMHVAASQYDEQSSINKANSFTVGDIVTNNMLNAYKEQNDIKANENFDKSESIDAVEEINNLLKEESGGVSYGIDAQEELNKALQSEDDKVIYGTDAAKSSAKAVLRATEESYRIERES